MGSFGIFAKRRIGSSPWKRGKDRSYLRYSIRAGGYRKGVGLCGARDTSCLGGTRCDDRHLPRTTSIPARMSSIFVRGRRETRSMRKSRSTTTNCETLATESLGSPVRRAARRTFPGASAQRRLLVRGTHTTVAIRLRFNGSPCTMTTGLRNPGPDPLGSGNSAHQTSPCETTTRLARGPAAQQRTRNRL